ncbi:aminopeptidase [Saliphagus sp. LR7]|uniref:aminopeptidase n=1 Tax=Saliphagus sp. LR7 TaxID=2282654 RepID=UPI000DF81048|nr:aminopeptidase [Saliphagus sp. LR7]
MDPRIERHASILVEHSTRVEPGDKVLVSAPPVAEDLVVALYEKLGEIGARPTLSMRSDRARRAFLRASDPEEFGLNEHSLARIEETDVAIGIRGGTNTNELGDVDPGTIAAFGRVQKPISDEYTEKRWVGTQYPAPGNAQEAEMSTAAYEEFVYNAVNRDWEAQREFQSRLVELLDPASEVRIESGDTTDLTMSVEGMIAVNDYGEKNLPGGEVFTAPVPDSVEGEVLFDKPLVTRGREITDASLEFEAGEVVAHSAVKNEELLTEILGTDDGARRLGELGIGMNRGIDRFTHNMLFDEKMGDTVHMAIGRTIDETVPDGRSGNESAVHVDMIVDMSEDSRIEIDGDVVQEDGTFVFEDDN